MAQNLPAAEYQSQGRGGLSAAFASGTLMKSILRFDGNAYVATGDGSDTSTDADTMVVEADTNDSALTLTVESATAEKGRLLVVFDGGGNATNNTITITGGTGVTINSDSGNIDNNNDARVYISDGTDFWEIGASG